ncbi:MAG: hypothetical protein ACKV2Q_11705 [Planctomycetaceae bacterium]
MTRTVLSILVVLLFSSLVTSRADDPKDPSAVVSHILDIEDSVAAGRDGVSLKDIATYYSDDIVTVSGGSTTFGIKAAQESLNRVSRDLAAHRAAGYEFERVHKLQPARMLPNGTAIVTVGTTTYLSLNKAVSKTTHVGIYVMIRYEDQWKVVLETINSSPAPKMTGSQTQSGRNHQGGVQRDLDFEAIRRIQERATKNTLDALDGAK